MAEEKISFKHWKTGKQVSYSIDNYGGGACTSSHILNDLQCPFDSTPLIMNRFVYGEVNISCPNCQTQYPSRSTQAEINQYAKALIEIRKKELSDLRNKASELEEFITFANNALAQTSPSCTDEGSGRLAQLQWDDEIPCKLP